jgi:sugar O-acyltransferase (sialic acid O-acetyltransferase NeuD family)
MRLAIFGAGGNGRELAALAQKSCASTDALDVVFVTDAGGGEVNGLPHLTLQQLLSDRDRSVNVSVADPVTRRQIVRRLEEQGFKFETLRAPTHVDYGAEVAEGAIFCDFTLTTTNVRIGRHFHCNYGSIVSHDCVIGDFVTFGPGVRCNGNVTIADDVYVGAGATIRQGIKIGRGAVIGMGAVVVKDVPAATTVVGNPARPLTASAIRSPTPLVRWFRGLFRSR